MLSKDKKIIIFGTGKGGEKLYQQLCTKFFVKYFVDNNKSKQGENLNGKIINSPTKILEENLEEIHVIIASMYFKEIKEQLDEYGLIYEADYSIAKIVRDESSEYGKFSGVKKGVPKEFIIQKGIDDVGNLVFDKENEKLYRVINDNKIQETKNVLSLYEKKSFMKKYLVKTKVVNNRNVIDREFVLEHEYIKDVTYVSEWSNQQIKDCGEFCLNFLKNLDEYGFTLKDIHSFNVTFNNGKFVWLDFGSIIKSNLKINTIYEFIKAYINLYIIINEKSKMRKSRDFSHEFIEFEDIEGYLLSEEREIYIKNIKKVNELFKSGKVKELICFLGDWLRKLGENQVYSMWNDYQDQDLINVDNKNLWSNKNKIIMAMIDKIEINVDSITDIAGSSGFFCFALAKNNKKCVLCDLDETAVEKAYKKIIKDKVTNIIPVITEFGQKSKYNFVEIDNRFKSDLVLAIAIEHHLVFQQQFTFDEIIENMCQYTNRYLLIEFTLPKNNFVSQWINEDFKWYTYENFLHSINKKLKVLAKDFYDEDTRILLMCEKVKNE